jgi:hypothetical protein
MRERPGALRFPPSRHEFLLRAPFPAQLLAARGPRFVRVGIDLNDDLVQTHAAHQEKPLDAVDDVGQRAEDGSARFDLLAGEWTVEFLCQPEHTGSVITLGTDGTVLTHAIGCR